MPFHSIIVTGVTQNIMWHGHPYTCDSEVVSTKPIDCHALKGQIISAEPETT